MTAFEKFWRKVQLTFLAGVLIALPIVLLNAYLTRHDPLLDEPRRDAKFEYATDQVAGNQAAVAAAVDARAARGWEMVSSSAAPNGRTILIFKRAK